MGGHWTDRQGLQNKKHKYKHKNKRYIEDTPADPFVRSAALQWVDRQGLVVVDTFDTKQPFDIPFLSFTS